MFVPLLDKLLSLVVFHSLPFQELIAFRLSLDAIQDSSEHQHESQQADTAQIMAVQDARQGNGKQDSSRHDECKDNGTKVLDGVKDEQLSNRGTNGKHEKVQMNLGMSIDKLKRRVEFLAMDKSDKGEYHRKGRCGKHEFDHGQVRMALKHATLPLACE
jgi:hypothetical protein